MQYLYFFILIGVFLLTVHQRTILLIQQKNAKLCKLQSMKVMRAFVKMAWHMGKVLL